MTGMTREQVERFNQMCKMRDDGKTIMEIAAHFGITKQRVSQIFRYHEMPLRIAVPDEVAQNMPDPVRLSALYGFKLDSMRARLKRMGFCLPKQPYRRSIWPIEKVMQLYQDYEAGMTQVQVAEKWKVDQSEISRLFRTNGLKTRGYPKKKRQTEN